MFRLVLGVGAALVGFGLLYAAFLGPALRALEVLP